MKQLLFTLIFLSNLASAFSFDVWESKITLNEAIQTAKANNIPLRKDGVYSAKKGFYERDLYLKKYPHNRVFRYITKLLNENATVYLYFTKNSKKLYNIKVRWMKRNKEFIDTVYELLDNKYGEKQTVISANIGDFILAKKRQWKPNDNTIIQTKTSMAGTELNYYDVEESHNEEREREEIKIEKKEKALIKDANKF
jgi:hypothetical protein